jgi:hypothetical protein
MDPPPSELIKTMRDKRQEILRSAGEDPKLAEHEWGIAHFARGKVLCKKCESEKVVLIEPGGGWMCLDEYTDVRWIPKPSDEKITSALLGLGSERLSEIQEFCSTPRTVEQIEESMPWLGDTYHLRALSVLAEAGKIGRRKAFIWSGWDTEKLNSAIERMATRPTREINNPKQEDIDNLTDEVEDSWDKLEKQ